MIIDRVKFYTVQDLSTGYNLEKAIKVIQQFKKEKRAFNINDIIELYNIKCFFDNGIYNSKWVKEEREQYIETVKTFPNHIGKFFGNITDLNILKIYESIERQYTEDFWHLFSYYKIYKNISPTEFYKILSTQKFELNEVLEQKRIVQHFGKVLKEYILSNCIFAELILDQFIVKKDGRYKDYYFPVDLTGEEMEKIILQYIKSPESNPNYLEAIEYAQSTKELPISDTTRLAAQRRYQNELDNFFEDKKGYEFSLIVNFSKDQKTEKEISYNRRNLSLSYSLDWIRQNLDFPTLLNNFIYLFEFTDIQSRSLHVHHEYTLGVLERMTGVHGRKDYFTGIAFNQAQALSVLQMANYSQVLKDNGVYLEDIFHWFFTKYLNEEFNINNFRISMPNENSTYLEKCRMIATEMEGILKQFALLVEYGNIDHELLQISSRPILYKDIPSFIEKKYIYAKGDNYQKVVYYFFSDQCMLAYIPRIKKHYNNFYDLLSNEEIRLNDYSLYKSNLEWMFKYGYLELRNNDIIEINHERGVLLKDLYKNGVSCNSYLGKYQRTINWMEKQNMIEYGSTLFSKQEQDYLNYLMNRSAFNNGLDLRNRYIHATQPGDEEAHKNNYYIFLNILVLIIIKINEEFCLR